MYGQFTNGSHALGRLRGELDRMLADAVNTFGGADAFGARGTRGPAINVWEADETFFAEAELPGMSLNDLELTVAGDELTLKGTRKEPQIGEATYHRRERGFGEFMRTLRLPAEVEADKVEANLRDGILTIRLPKAPAARARKIEVKTSAD